jgi:formamidopyrimidine-DNA glycosylase
VPELIEVELYRRLAARTVGRRISAVCSPDAWDLKGGLDAVGLEAAVTGATVGGARRIGKLLLLDLHVPDGAGGSEGSEGSGGSGGLERPTLGLRFGMTGQLLVDGDAAIERLEYGSARAVPEWDRFRLVFADGRSRDGGGGAVTDGRGDLVIRDPRRLGGVFLDVDEDRLGRDAATIDVVGLTDVLGVSSAPLKARLMDQRRLAGLGNLLTDEILWQAGLAPGRRAGALTPVERKRLARIIRSTVAELTERGGSHTGELQPARQRGALCPRDAAVLRRETVGGRTTYWCPHHQV